MSRDPDNSGGGASSQKWTGHGACAHEFGVFCGACGPDAIERLTRERDAFKAEAVTLWRKLAALRGAVLDERADDYFDDLRAALDASAYDASDALLAAHKEAPKP